MRPLVVVALIAAMPVGIGVGQWLGTPALEVEAETKPTKQPLAAKNQAAARISTASHENGGRETPVQTKLEFDGNLTFKHSIDQRIEPEANVLVGLEIVDDRGNLVFDRISPLKRMNTSNTDFIAIPDKLEPGYYTVRTTTLARGVNSEADEPYISEAYFHLDGDGIEEMSFSRFSNESQNNMAVHYE